MEKCEMRTADKTEKYQAIAALHEKILAQEDPDAALWQAILAHQNYPFRTSSGLEFSYTVKRNKRGEYSGELLISRKETSKTLTKSSIFLAFHQVLSQIHTEEVQTDAGPRTVLHPPEYKGPKAIGQIFGISYIYSIFWTLGLITVPEKVAARLNPQETA
jgi:hypothetical protein